MNPLLFQDTTNFAGTERHVLDLATGLQAAGIRPTLACPEDSALAVRAKALDLDVFPIQASGLVHRNTVLGLVKRLRSGKQDIIHAHNGRTALTAAVAVQLAGTGRVVFTQHFLEPGHVKRGGLSELPGRLVHRWVQARTHRFIAISEAVRHQMLERKEAPDEQITTVPNGLTCDSKALKPPFDIRQEFNITADAPLVVCVARLEPEKDIATLLTAMQAVRKAHPTARALVVGEGSLLGALQAKVDELDIAETTQFAGFREDARSFIQAADVFVLPSLAEPFGLVLLEAMALGKPVIATNAGGPCEIVVERETGMLVPPGDPAAMAAALESLLSQPALRGRMGTQGLLRHQKLYSVDVMAANTIAVYETALNCSAQ